MTTKQALVPFEGTGRELSHPLDHEEEPPSALGTVGPRGRTGLLLIALFFAGFGWWAARVPLAGGAVAPAVISPDGSRKIVQHLEGGIIARLHVRDGDVVEAGQALVELKDEQPRASHQMQVHQRRVLLARRARLEAEKNGRTTVSFPDELQSAAEEVVTLVAGQLQLFETRRAAHETRSSVLQQRTVQLETQIRGFQAQVKSTEQQTELIAEELEGKLELWKQRLLRKSELLRLQRMQADLTGQKGEHIASIAQAQEKIGETKLQLLTLDAERADTIATELDKVLMELAAVQQQLQATGDVLNRTVIAAPVGGTVVNLRFKTVGGVVKPGDEIMGIVPTNDKLLIDARVSPVDIDVVRNGLIAKVLLSAFSGRDAPRINGIVRSVSADRLTDENTHQPYYLARVEVDRKQLASLGPRIELVPGMPAEVLIVTGERTMMDYLLEPFMKALKRSFRET